LVPESGQRGGKNLLDGASREGALLARWGQARFSIRRSGSEEGGQGKWRREVISRRGKKVPAGREKRRGEARKKNDSGILFAGWIGRILVQKASRREKI